MKCDLPSIATAAMLITDRKVETNLPLRASLQKSRIMLVSGVRMRHSALLSIPSFVNPHLPVCVRERFVYHEYLTVPTHSSSRRSHSETSIKDERLDHR